MISLYATGDPQVINQNELQTNFTISKSCRTTSRTVKDYWKVVQNEYLIKGLNSSSTDQGLVFVTANEKITSSLLGSYSIIGFYTIIVYAIGTILRKVSIIDYDHLTITITYDSIDRTRIIRPNLHHRQAQTGQLALVT